MTTEPNARVVGANQNSALVIVDDVRVRIQHRSRGRRTLCDDHPNTSTCEHIKEALRALEERKTS